MSFFILAVFILRLLLLLCEVFTLLIVLRTIISWLFPGHLNMLTRFLHRLTEPILMPLRRILPKLAGLDLSPFVSVVILQALVQLIIFVLGGA
ncbi:MAG: YggT family protein [Chloroflexi bacterium]|nr:YggT family protein [Chloroflexota bacterium]